MSQTPDLLETAVWHFQSGRLAECEQACRLLLETSPESSRRAQATYLLATVRFFSGDTAAAVGLFAQAIALESELAEALLQWSLQLLHDNKTGAGAQFLRLVVDARPEYFEARANLGAALVELDHFDEALVELNHAARLRPDSAETHYNLGNAHWKLGELQEAAAAFRRALTLRPEFVAPRCHLGAVLQEQGDLPGAAEAYLESLRLQPNYVIALNNYGKLLHDQGRHVEAIEYYNRALRLRPQFALGFFNRANLHAAQGNTSDAVADYQQAISLQPAYTQAYNNLVLLFYSERRFDELFETCQRAFAAGVSSASLHATRGNTLRAVGQGSEAVEAFRRSLEHSADPVQHSNLIYALNFVDDEKPAAIFAEHQSWSRQFAEPLTQIAQPHANDCSPARRLRIGYVSAHFREHAVNFFVEPLLSAHDQSRFEVYCYASLVNPDQTTERVKSCVEHWRDIANLDDGQAARLIRDDAIDILVDLAGHIGENRLLVFARRPAPIQVTYIGYQNTTGMSAMDYRLTDEWSDPPSLSDSYYTEQLIRLPRAFFCYRPSDYAPSITPLPALEQGVITFGSFNSLAKVTPRTLECWLSILARVEPSRLLVLADHAEHFQRRVSQACQGSGIDPQRIVLCDKRPRPDYLRLIQMADIALDPFPFNGHTTTCDSIWMGVPVIMMAGHNYASRFGGSVLANVGLKHLITESTQQYVETAVALAADREQLAQLRVELRPRMAASALCDFAGFARDVEAAYETMWTTWCERKLGKH